jgi:dolichol-phosphate mannosyltransferase
MPFTDPTGGYKCFHRRALEAIALDEVRSNGYSFQVEMTHKLWRQGYQIVEVPIIFTERVMGHSKMSGHIVSEAFWMVWRLWFQNGCRRSPRPPNGKNPPPRAKEQSADKKTDRPKTDRTDDKGRQFTGTGGKTSAAT